MNDSFPYLLFYLNLQDHTTNLTYGLGILRREILVKGGLV